MLSPLVESYLCGGLSSIWVWLLWLVLTCPEDLVVLPVIILCTHDRGKGLEMTVFPNKTFSEFSLALPQGVLGPGCLLFTYCWEYLVNRDVEMCRRRDLGPLYAVFQPLFVTWNLISIICFNLVSVLSPSWVFWASWFASSILWSQLLLYFISHKGFSNGSWRWYQIIQH